MVKGKIMIDVGNPNQRGTFDSWGFLTHKRSQMLDGGWPGFFRDHILASIPLCFAYNLSWCYRPFAQESHAGSTGCGLLTGIRDNTTRIARLKPLLTRAKLAFHNEGHEVNCPIYDTTTSSMARFLRFLDAARAKVRPWMDDPLWR